VIRMSDSENPERVVNYNPKWKRRVGRSPEEDGLMSIMT
jgi:hypothetical protein